jgi:hypothetical protein
MDEVKMKYPLAVKHRNATAGPNKSSLSVHFFELNIYVNEVKFFKRYMPDITPNLLALKNKEDCIRLTRKPLTFYQNQFNMAIWFATTGCGISVEDHLNHEIPLIRSVYRFHAYYQIRKILKTLKIPFPGEDSFNEINNNMNRAMYRKLLSEFNLGDEYDFSVFGNNAGWDSWGQSDFDPNIIDPRHYITDSQIKSARNDYLSNDAKVPPMSKTDWDKGMDSLKRPGIMCYLWAFKDSINSRKNTFDVIT